jgi:hypothetical protein
MASSCPPGCAREEGGGNEKLRSANSDEAARLKVSRKWARVTL